MNFQCQLQLIFSRSIFCVTFILAKPNRTLYEKVYDEQFLFIKMMCETDT